MWTANPGKAIGGVGTAWRAAIIPLLGVKMPRLRSRMDVDESARKLLLKDPEELKSSLCSVLEQAKVEVKHPPAVEPLIRGLPIKLTLFLGSTARAIDTEMRVLRTIDKSLPFEDMTEGDADLIVERLQAALDEVAAGKAAQ